MLHGHRVRKRSRSLFHSRQVGALQYWLACLLNKSVGYTVLQCSSRIAPVRVHLSDMKLLHVRCLTEIRLGSTAIHGELSLASVGPATTQHIGFEMLRHLAKIDVNYVPYPGGAPAVTALLGGHVTSVLGNYSEVIEQLEARKLRALAATSSTRIEPLPDLPTVAESGYKGYDVQVWFGLIAP